MRRSGRLLESTAISVAVIPENPQSPAIADIRKAELSPGGSLLCCLLEPRGRLLLWDAADGESPPSTVVDAGCSAFSWEEEPSVPDPGAVPKPRLVAVESGCDLKLLEVEVGSAPISVLCVSDCPADHLLKTIREQDHNVSQLRSLDLLSFISGRCFVLLNDRWLLQLHWQRHEALPQIVTCCSIEQPISEGDDDRAVHHCVCRGAAFVLSSSGLISVCDITDGRLLARVDLPAYLSCSQEEDDFMVSSGFSSPATAWTSFCLFQVSADLSTAVAVTQTHSAVAVDLDQYFRTFPDHLLCASKPARPAPGPRYPGDQDSTSNSSLVVTDLGFTFSTDRSWEARLSSLNSRALQTPYCTSSSRPCGPSWTSCLPHLDSAQIQPWSHSRVPQGAASVSFPVPESLRPVLLSVSGFSAVLTFVCPGNQQTTVACWDWQQDSVSVHQGDGEAAPLQRCGERQHRLLLQKDGVVQVLFSVSQQDLLTKLMLFGNAATVDAVCHLNSWGRCSIPIHSLQAGLKNRQLDTVDFYLKSKENVLDESAADQSSSLNLTESVQLLCPALDLLCSSVRESNSEAQSRQFSEQLLGITLNFVNTQIRRVLSSSHYDGPDVHSCVDVLHRYLMELRSYMKRFPWPAGGSTCTTDSATLRKEEQQDEWERLPVEEVVRQSILTNQIPRAQAVLRRRGLPEQRLSSLRTEGLRQVFSCLQQQDLDTATSLLVNMGFDVKDQLHRLCLYTDDPRLRDFVVEELRRRNYFSKEEIQNVEFIRQVEKLGSLPTPPRHLDNFTARSVQMLGKETGVVEEVLEDLLSSRRSGEEAQLWRNLRLDWVRNWDQSCQSAVLLSRLEHRELTSCDPVVLWHHLTSIHDQDHIVRWIQGQESACGATQWPELVPELVNNNTLCSVYMKEKILDLLARRHLFIPDELEDLQRLLWRLAQGGGVMATTPSLPHYRSSQGLDFHALFITFCLDHGLQYLLYTYLQHHRLTPRNCPTLSIQSLSESQPWFDMMVKIQEITRDLTDPALIFQASLTSAQVLLPGSQASLSSLLLEGHSLLALAAIMFAPGGIDQVVLQGESCSNLERAVDPQLLKMALAPHSKLKAALFPTTPRGHGMSSDTSIYHLLQSLHPLDPTRLFGWQTANTISSTEISELPHFSSPQLVQTFALVENLDFLYYLRHGRPSFAYATFLVQQMSSGGDPTLLSRHAQQGAYRLALQHFHVASVTSAAVCFCELLGVCSLKLRVDVRALNIVLIHWNQHRTHSDPVQRLQTLGQKLVEAEPTAAAELIGWLEASVSESVEQKGLVRSSYGASQEWTIPVQFCQLHSLDLSSVYPDHCAQDGQFIHFLLFVQLHSFPPHQVRRLAAGFGPALQAHLSLVFQDLNVYPEDKECPTTAKDSGSGDRPRELFQVLLQSQDQDSPSRFLLTQSLLQRCRTLAVIAACPQEAEPLACLCVWVLTSVDDVTAGDATSHLPEPAQHTEWTLQDLSVIWKTLLGRGQVRPLLQGFQLFMKDCPLVLMLSMFDLCCDYRNFSEAKKKLLDFQRMLITLRTSGSVSSPIIPLQWVEAQASVLLLTLLERCSSQYDLHHLLQLLADVDVLFKSSGPDFRMLSQLSQLLQDSDLTLSPRLLKCTSPSVQQEELQATVDALQAKGRYTQARRVAELAGLPVHHLLLGQLLQEANSSRSTPQWRRLETRVTFWKKCQEQLKADGLHPEFAAKFLLSQAECLIGTAAEDVKECPLLDTQERHLLLGLAAHWLSQLSPPPVQELQALEERQWRSRVQLQLLTTSMEKQSVFNLPGSNLGPDVDAYQAMVKEFSFSNISVLNTDNFLNTDGLPAPVEPGQQDVQSGLTVEERQVMQLLVGQLLDQGSVHEASRVCRYFRLHHPDLWLVLQCRGLASGELLPQPQDKSAEMEPISRVPSSASFGSLSLSMLSLPEDQVTVELQRLVDQCRHGTAYCKQVLSLYRLSKELETSFSQVIREEPRSVLERLLHSDQPDRFRKAQVFIRAQGLSPDYVAELVCSAVTRSLMTTTLNLSPTHQELQTERPVVRPSEGRDSMIQLIKLCEDPNLVGARLMEELNSLPLRELSCMVELLIVAHDCFSLTCNMEGIVRVLQAARHLSHVHIAPGEHYSLLVRLLTGVGRYPEMTYIFDLLHQNHRFEMLLRRKVDMDQGQSSGLKTALLDYIKRCLPADSEKYNMVALCFSMRREIGENHEMAARTQLKMIESQPWVVTADLTSSLVKVLALLKDAAESFSKDWCVRQATRCVRTAKLVSLQLHILNQGSDVRVINLQPGELLSTVVLLPRCYQVFVVSEAYGYSPDWAEILHQKVVLNGDFVFLEELRRHRPLTSSLFEDIFKKLDSAPSSVTPNVKRLLSYCEDVYTRYRLAYQRNLSDVAENLLQDVKTSNYLNDRLSS